MGNAYILTKTLNRVSTEMSLHDLAYNVKRVMNILGAAARMEAMRAYIGLSSKICLPVSATRVLGFKRR